MASRTLLTLIALIVIGSSGVDAAQRTFVASYGADTNPCSATQPCRSFATAMTVTDMNGEVLVLDTAGYGTVTIGQSVTIAVADGVYAGITVTAGSGVTVNGAGIEVALRGLAINGKPGNDGIRIDNAAIVHIDRVTITNMAMSGGDSGIRVAASGARVFVSDSDISANGGYGILMDGDSELTVNRCTIERNGFMGVRMFQTAGKIVVRDSSISRNGNAAVDLSTIDSQAIDAVVAGNLVFATFGNGIVINSTFGTGVGAINATVTDNAIHANGGYGLQAAGLNSRMIIAGNVVTANSTGLQAANAPNIRSAGDNVIDSNNAPDGATVNAATVK
jgi:hypothetical protein